MLHEPHAVEQAFDGDVGLRDTVGVREGDALAALERGEWQVVFDLLSPRRADLDVAGLSMLADAAWWLGDAPLSITLSERVFQGLEGAGDVEGAARRAVELSAAWAVRGDVPVAAAWRARAHRLLDGLPDSVTHGYLTYVDAMSDLDLTGDPLPMERAARELDELASRLSDPGLRSLTLVLGGLAAVRQGRVEAAFAELDEAMLPVLAGEVGPRWSGDVFCIVIHLCYRLGDLARMRTWVEALTRWSGQLSRTFAYVGIGRLHELELAAAHGDWDRVDRELAARSADLVGAHRWLAGAGYYTLGEVRRLRGDRSGALAAYEQARALGCDPQPGAALVLAADGETERALGDLRVALTGLDRLARRRVLVAAVDLTLTVGDLDQAEVFVAELEDTAAWFGTPGPRADAARCRAALLLASGRADAALSPLDEAVSILRGQRDRYATAAVHEQLALAHDALGRPGAAAADRATARAIYAALGAERDLDRLAARSRPGGLTEREVEVLGLICGGATNQDIARALTISPKTVSRHLSNIYTKIDVTTRTAAAAWAHEHGW